MISPDKPNTEGYIRICLACGHEMHWYWGTDQSHFDCGNCGRREKCATVIIEGDIITGKLTVIDGDE